MTKQYMDLALSSLEKISVEEERKENLKIFIDQLLNRKK